ncbi:hypothetical protein QR721_05285 [Aciduricibacillus chroicocephali]|uniref:Uncharacterized protein n=1 Tax=Aciduricibacillus chroicocephali TaxID=3054939 RepID=A0ABY9KZ10_9BACI|nr:hypothetical protein QR721_05285 [Bacillaceae bacterium 44XB]
MDVFSFEIEVLWPMILCLFLFTFIYILLLPLAKWIVQAGATRLLAYLASGSFCVGVLYSCMLVAPNLVQRFDIRLPLQYFACFGLALGLIRLIGGRTGRRAQAANYYKGRQSGQ